MPNPLRIAGPVFEFELLTTSRRGRYYTLRAGYALILLLVLWQVYQGWVDIFGQMMTPREASRFALTMFTSISVLQEVLVLVLTPALVAGVIAAEKQSKTLHYVLASPLNSAEVVLGKLLSRLLHVAVFLGVSWPVTSMLVLLGGVDPRLVALGCAVGVSSAWFLAALSVLASTYARRVREALFLAYALEALWLFGPDVVRYAFAFAWNPLVQAVDAVNGWFLASSPVSVGWQTLMGVMMGGVGVSLDDLISMIEIQAAGGALFAALAVWRLRPVFRKQEGTSRPMLAAALKARRSWRSHARPECGDRPLVWKELYTSRGTRLSRIIGALVILALGGPLAYWTGSYALAAFREAWDQGNLDRQLSWVTHRDRFYFMHFLQAVTPLVFVVMLLRVAGAAASSVTSEHEDDTWVSLTTTDLTASEVVGAKMLGAVWGGRWVVPAMALMVWLGVASGALHPLALLYLGLLVLVCSWFTAAFGLWVSLGLRSTWRAQFLTIAGLIFVNVAAQTALNVLTWPPRLVWPGFMPVDLSRALVEPGYLAELADQTPGSLRALLDVSQINWGAFWRTALLAVSLTAYTSFATVLTWASVRRFETAAGRARRASQRHAVPDGGDGEGTVGTTLPLPAAAD
jgi:ABC-type transport system involved in multi-copper enzyme maturation permease subunit